MSDSASEPEKRVSAQATRSQGHDSHPNAPGNGPPSYAAGYPQRTASQPRQDVARVSSPAPTYKATKRARPAAVQPDGGDLRGLPGDLLFSGERVFLKLDRHGGDLFGLKRAVLELGAGTGDRVMLTGVAPDGSVTECFTVVAQAREGELELANSDPAGARIGWDGIRRVRALTLT